MGSNFTLWLLDHGAYWSECVGDTLATPWYRLSAWCYREWCSRRYSD